MCDTPVERKRNELMMTPNQQLLLQDLICNLNASKNYLENHRDASRPDVVYLTIQKHLTGIIDKAQRIQQEETGNQEPPST
jgi:hypothetical protein